MSGPSDTCAIVVHVIPVPLQWALGLVCGCYVMGSVARAVAWAWAVRWRMRMYRRVERVVANDPDVGFPLAS